MLSSCCSNVLGGVLVVLMVVFGWCFGCAGSGWCFGWFGGFGRAVGALRLGGAGNGNGFWWRWCCFARVLDGAVLVVFWLVFWWR